MTKKTIADDLRAQLVDLEGRQVELLAERDEHSFDALVTRDKGAIERLSAINSELANLTIQSGSLEAALREALKREAAARSEDARKADRQKAKRLREELLPEFAKHCDGMDKALEALVAHIEGATATIRELNAVGAGPIERLFLLNGVKVVNAALWKTPWRQEFRPIPPNERHLFTELLDASWAAAIRRRADELDGSQQPSAKAA